MEEQVAAPDQTKPKMWGPLSGILLGLTIFIGAQIMTALIIGVLAELNGVEISDYFDQHTVLVTFVGSVLLGGLSVGFVYWATKSYGSWQALKLAKPKLSQFGLIIPAFVIYVMLSAVIYTVTSILFPGTNLDQEQQIGFESANTMWQLGVAFIALVIIAPVAEEILFRGYTYQGVRRNFHWIIAAVISAGLFGLAHMQLNVALDTFALGIVACWLLEKTGSLWPAILLHGIKNSIAFYFIFVVG